MDRHIPQPPHSAGLKYKGLRSRIDPSQIPSPIQLAREDEATWLDQPFMTCSSQLPVPLSGSEYVAIDQGNSTPRFLRLTTYGMPNTSNIATASDIPLGAIIQPFAERRPEEDAVPIVNFGGAGPPRCSQPWCRAYINPWCIFTYGGLKWKCNICQSETEVNSEYYCSLDSDLHRSDRMQRPELTRGTVDFAVPEEYWANQPLPRLIPSFQTPLPRPISKRKPQPMRYVFAIDVSYEAVQSGVLRTVCSGLKNILYGPTPTANENGNAPDDITAACFPTWCQIAILTFDQTLHFYNLSSSLERVKIHIVSDINEVFVPMYEEFFAFQEPSRKVIETLLETLPNTFQNTDSRGGAAVGAAITASLASLTGRGGQVIVFNSSYPAVGSGSLTKQEPESNIYGTDKERSLFLPRDSYWTDLGEECAEEGVSVSLFLTPTEAIELSSLRMVSSLTGGDIFFHPRYTPGMDQVPIISMLRRVITRETAYNCMMRVRCSNGLRVSNYYGNFYKRSQFDLDIAKCDADKAIAFTLEHSGIPLDERGNAFIQSSLLYTSSTGERRVRTCNMAIPVFSLAGNIFRHSDQETVITLWTKQAIAAMQSRPLRKIRDQLTEKCITLLLAYRKHCAASSPPSQLVLPEQFKLLPLYTLAIMKNRAIKGRFVASDVRIYHAHRLSGLGVATTMQFLYPKVLALHDLLDNSCIPDPTTGQISFPSLMRNSYLWMEGNGLYLADDGEKMILWIGSSVSPQLLRDLYGVDAVHDLDVRNPRIPPGASSIIATQIRNIFTHRELRRCFKIKFYLARQDLDGYEIDFSDMLVEDENNEAMSYVDYLCYVHKQINISLTGGFQSNNTLW